MTYLSVVDEKHAMRARMRTINKSISIAERQAASARVCERLMQQEEWKNAGSILFFLPLRDELDLRSCMDQAAREGKTVTLPRFIPEEGKYCAAVWDHSAASLASGAFGIMEPGAASPVCPPNRLDLALVPGLGFSLDGVRLGRGKGFYDRLLVELTALKCGVALDEQILDRVPTEPHDIRMNCILTPTRWIAVDMPRRTHG